MVNLNIIGLFYIILSWQADQWVEDCGPLRRQRLDDLSGTINRTFADFYHFCLTPHDIIKFWQSNIQDPYLPLSDIRLMPYFHQNCWSSHHLVVERLFLARLYFSCCIDYFFLKVAELASKIFPHRNVMSNHFMKQLTYPWPSRVHLRQRKLKKFLTDPVVWATCQMNSFI